MTQDVALRVSSCMIRHIIGALCMLYTRRLELLGVAGTMLSNERGPLLLQKSETDESLSSAVLKRAFIGEMWACRYERRCCSVSDLCRGVSLQRANAALGMAAGFAVLLRGLPGPWSWA